MVGVGMVASASLALAIGLARLAFAQCSLHLAIGLQHLQAFCGHQPLFRDRQQPLVNQPQPLVLQGLGQTGTEHKHSLQEVLHAGHWVVVQPVISHEGHVQGSCSPHDVPGHVVQGHECLVHVMGPWGIAQGRLGDLHEDGQSTQQPLPGVDILQWLGLG